MEADGLTFVPPADVPRLTGEGWRALLRVLTDAAEDEFGPDWRRRLPELALGAAE